MLFTNIWELLYDIKISGVRDILNADNPIKSELGWISQEFIDLSKEIVSWEISLSDFKKTLQCGDEKSILILRKYFFNKRNQLSIIQLVDSLPNLERLMKLKVFW